MHACMHAHVDLLLLCEGQTVAALLKDLASSKINIVRDYSNSQLPTGRRTAILIFKSSIKKTSFNVSGC